MSDPIIRLNAALEGRYRVESHLGEGGMATVYLADDLKHERKVALKVLKPELAAVVGAERFLGEIKTTANLQHPHILPLFDSGEADGFLFYVMPYVEGETLRARIDRDKQLGVEEALRITKAVAAALDYAHRHGVIHRDVKPENVLVHDGEPLVADFGIALAVTAAGGGRLTETGLSLGTPYYMSPEQAAADRDPGPQSDVYSLACILYEMLIGDPPHTGSSAQAVLAKILTEKPRAVTELRETVPPHVGSAIARGLERLPADRFESAADFAAGLADESFMHVRVARPERVAAPVPAAEPVVGVDRRLFGIVATVAVVAVAVAVWGWLQPQPESLPDAPTRLPIDLGDMSLGGSDEILVSPDGSRFAVAATVNGTTSLYWRRASEEEFRIIPGTAGAREATFSPEGEWIAFVSEGRGLFKVSLLGGAPTPLVPAGNVGPREPSWGSEGLIVFGGAAGVFQVPDTGGQPELLHSFSQQLRHPSLLPGGGVIGADRGGAGVTYLAPGTDSVRVLIPGGLDPKYIETGHILYADAAGGLWAVRFDPELAEVQGGSVPIFDGLRVIRAVHARYSVSRNGTLVYGAGGAIQTAGQSRLIVVDLEGGVEAPPLDPRDFSDVRWSPEGASVAYTAADGAEGNRNIYTYDVQLATTPRQLTFEGDNDEPVWSPDGTRVAFASQREGSDLEDLYVKDVNSDSPPERVLALPQAQSPTHWPDDELLVFQTGNPRDIWIAELSSDTAVAREYLSSEDQLFSAEVSPDGDLAAYQDCGTPGCEVYVRSFPEPGARERVSVGGGQVPSWSPDGGTIYYWTPATNGRRTFMAAQVRRGPPFVVSTRDSLFSGVFNAGSSDLHPDGDRVVTTQPVAAVGAEMADGDAEALEERFLVVVNWFEELGERMGGS